MATKQTAGRTGTTTNARAQAAAKNTSGGTPVVGTSAPTPQADVTQTRLQKQRSVADEKAKAQERTQLAMERRGEKLASAGGSVFTAVSRNGLAHRRNGILFGADPVSVDISGWTEEQKQRFFNDTILMIVSGQQLGAPGGLLAPAAGPKAAGGSTENATPEMLAAAAKGVLLSHPASGAGSPVIGSSQPHAARQLEEMLNDGGDDDNT